MQLAQRETERCNHWKVENCYATEKLAAFYDESLGVQLIVCVSMKKAV